MTERLHRMIDGVKIYMTPEEEAELRAEWAKNEAQQKATQYIKQRVAEYGHWEDQLDFMYHNGFEAWKEKIETIKTKYPKP